MYLQIKHKIGLLLAALLCSAPALATPITYTFTTGPLEAFAPATTPNVAALIPADAYVSGSFTYDPDGLYRGQSAITAGGIEYPGASYQAISDMEGSLHMGSLGSSYTFSTGQGVANVYNDIQLPINVPPMDFLILGFAPTVSPLNGFTLGNLPLYSVALARSSSLSLLDNSDLPPSLPTLSWTLGLSFGTPDANGHVSDQASFYNVTVTPVPVPGAAMLLMSGMFTLVAGARVRRRGNLTA